MKERCQFGGSYLFVVGREVSWERWESSELGRWERCMIGVRWLRWERWENSEVARSERWERNEAAIWERWEGSEQGRWDGI